MSAFTPQLLQAISDWQRGGNPKQKNKRAEALVPLARVLPVKYRRCKTLCYRQLSIEKGHIYKLNDRLRLPETVSSWTLDPAIAQNFKGGVPPHGQQGIIFSIFPPPGSVVLNLDTLLDDDEFKAAVAQHQASITGFGDGLARYGNTQREVILRLDHIRLRDVFALGGYSGTEKEIARLYYQREPDFADLVNFYGLMKQTSQQVGPRWVAGAAKDRVIARLQSRMPEMRTMKLLQVAFDELVTDDQV